MTPRQQAIVLAEAVRAGLAAERFVPSPLARALVAAVLFLLGRVRR